MQCSKCATAIPHGQNYCPQCFTTIKRPSWWRRFLNWLNRDRAQVRMNIIRTERIELLDPATGQRRVAGSLEDVPPALQAQLEEMQRKVLLGEESTAFVFRDFSGKEQTYHSVEEMPPAVRALLEDVRRLGQGTA